MLTRVPCAALHLDVHAVGDLKRGEVLNLWLIRYWFGRQAATLLTTREAATPLQGVFEELSKWTPRTSVRLATATYQEYVPHSALR